MITTRARAALVAFFLLAAPVLPAGWNAEDSPVAWLERMSAAMNHLTYQGTFVYIQGSETETMRITHHSGEDGVRERIVALSGPKREVIRDAGGVRWVSGESGSILADNAFKSSFLPGLPADLERQTSASYALKFGEFTRIAGHAARHVMVLPRDHYRYGHSLWLEKHTGLPLQWELFDSKRKTLAKFVFTELLIGAEVDLRELKADNRVAAYRTVPSELPSGKARKTGLLQWAPRKLPPGFTLEERRVTDESLSSGSLYEHLVYSDGLAAVSVYVESQGEDSPRITGVERHGTTHAYSCSNDGVSVTVVGNVPAATVELIGKSVAASRP